MPNAKAQMPNEGQNPNDKENGSVVRAYGFQLSSGFLLPGFVQVKQQPRLLLGDLT